MHSHTNVAPGDCTLAFDIDDQKYLFISPGISAVLGITAGQLNHSHNLWENLIDHKDVARIKKLTKCLTENNPVELTYQINTPQQTVKNISDKKSLIIDECSGHKILLSTIKEEPLSNKPSAAPQKLRQHENAGLSKQFLNSLIDSQTSFLIRIDVNGNYIFANRQYLKTFGYKAKDLLGKHFSITTIPNETHLCRNAFNKCINTPGKIIPLLHKKPDACGNLHDTEWELISIVDENGQVCAIQGIGHDITNRLKTEAEIKKTSQKLDTFIESITDAFFIVDNDWKFVRVNAAFEKVTNKNRSQVLNKVIWDIFPSIVNTGFERAFLKAKTTRQSIKFTEDFTIVNKWFNVSVYPSGEGLTVFVRDVTEKKHAQEEAVSTRNSLEALIDNTTDQIWSVDTESRYVYMNNAYINHIIQLTGKAPQKGDLSYMHTKLPKQIIDDWHTNYQRALKGERYTIIGESVHNTSKEQLFFEINFNPIYSSKGCIMGVGCFARDITSRLKAEQELLRQNKRMFNIASLSSHELRRPVASMLGLMNIIDKENPENPDNRQIMDYLYTVSTEIDDVIRLIVDHTFTGD